MIITHTSSRRDWASHKRDWTWLYIVVFVVVAAVSYSFEKEIEVNQLVLPVDYN